MAYEGDHLFGAFQVSIIKICCISPSLMSRAFKETNNISQKSEKLTCASLPVLYMDLAVDIQAYCHTLKYRLFVR